MAATPTPQASAARGFFASVSIVAIRSDACLIVASRVVKNAAILTTAAFTAAGPFDPFTPYAESTADTQESTSVFIPAGFVASPYSAVVRSLIEASAGPRSVQAATGGTAAGGEAPAPSAPVG